MWANNGKTGIYKKLLSAAAISICLILCGCAGTKGDRRSSGFSEPLKESQVIKLSLDSKYMGRKVPFLVYLPKGYGGGNDYPVWYGLHGYSSDETMWLDDAGIGKEADKMTDNGEIEPLIMVFPYTRDATLKEIQKDLADDGKFGEINMDQFICKELVPYIDSNYDTAASADGRYIGGFSMGGMIALRVAFHHPDMFSKVGGYSAAVISSDYSGNQLEKWLFPYDNTDGITDIAAFDREKGLDKLTVYLDAGKTNEPFAQGLQSLYDALQKRGIKSEFHSCEGGHSIDRAIKSLADYLKFYVSKK